MKKLFLSFAIMAVFLSSAYTQIFATVEKFSPERAQAQKPSVQEYGYTAPTAKLDTFYFETTITGMVITNQETGAQRFAGTLKKRESEEKSFDLTVYPNGHATGNSLPITPELYEHMVREKQRHSNVLSEYGQTDDFQGDPSLREAWSKLLFPKEEVKKKE